MPTFKVWDTLNSERDYAEDVEARSPEDAAVQYAEDDVDGWCDGLYHEGPQAVAVLSGDVVLVFDVSAELIPSFRAVPVGTPTP